MIELSNLTAQTIQPGQAVTFDRVINHSGNGECWNRQLPTTVKLRQCGGSYSISFSGNVSATTAGDALQLSIAVGGVSLVQTEMDSTPGTADTFNNVSTRTLFKNCCGDLNRVSVINTGTVPVNLKANSSLAIERRG